MVPAFRKAITADEKRRAAWSRHPSPALGDSRTRGKAKEGGKGRICAGVWPNTMQSVSTATCWDFTVAPLLLAGRLRLILQGLGPVIPGNRAAGTDAQQGGEAGQPGVPCSLPSASSPSSSLPCSPPAAGDPAAAAVSHPADRRASPGEGAVGQRTEFTVRHCFKPSPAPPLVPKPALPRGVRAG